MVRKLTQFYGLIARHSIKSFDYTKAAELELAWWDVHRRSYVNNPELEQSLADGAAAIYNVPAKSLREYAHYRAEAMILPRHEGDEQLIPVDWQKVTSLLVKAWDSLHTVVQK